MSPARPSRRYAVTAAALLLGALIAALAACGGGGDGGNRRPGQLTDPGSVPSVTPWADPPDPIILDPDNLTPIGSDGGGDNVGDGEDSGDDGDDSGVTPQHCGETYTVISGDNPSIIAEKCGVTTDELLAANPGLDPSGLHIGDKINIPQ